MAKGRKPRWTFYVNPDGVLVECRSCPWVSSVWISHPDFPEKPIWDAETRVLEHHHLEHKGDPSRKMKKNIRRWKKEGLTDEQLRQRFYGIRPARGRR